jgi:hypothetical protein
VPGDLRGFDAADVVIETTSGEYVKAFRDVSYDPVERALYRLRNAPDRRLAKARRCRRPCRRRPFVGKFVLGGGAGDVEASWSVRSDFGGNHCARRLRRKRERDEGRRDRRTK